MGGEKFGLSWIGKSECKKLVDTPCDYYLEFASEESVNADTTQNIFIEGDNLPALKLDY